MSKDNGEKWLYSHEGGTRVLITDYDGYSVFSMSVTANSTGHSDLVKNAQLVASAPELLQALKALVARTNPNEQYIYNYLRKDWETAVTVINKAEYPQ
jgi:tRNA C32,U32 (ribose-2'-O)-methylase TrmJ